MTAVAAAAVAADLLELLAQEQGLALDRVLVMAGATAAFRIPTPPRRDGHVALVTLEFAYPTDATPEDLVALFVRHAASAALEVGPMREAARP